MPKPLVFHREIVVGQKDPISIENIVRLRPQDSMANLVATGDSAVEALNISYFSRDYVLPEDFLDEPSSSSAQLGDMGRTKFIYIYPYTIKEGEEPDLFVLNEGASTESLVTKLEGLSKHKPTQWLLLTMLRQGLIKTTKDTESLTYTDAIFKEAHENDYQQFLARASTESGYYVFNSPGVVTVVDVQLIYGSSFNTTCCDKVRAGDQPDMVYLTHFIFKEKDDKTVSVSVQDYTLIYKMTRFTLFLMLQHPEFLGELQQLSCGEPPIFLEIRHQNIPLGAKENKKVLEGFSVDNVSRNENEKAYVLALDVIVQQSDLTVQQVYQAIIDGKILKSLLEGVSLFLTNHFSVNNISGVKNSKESSCHQRFKTHFEAVENNITKLENLIYYLQASITESIKKNWFFDDTISVRLPLKEGAMQRSLLQYLFEDEFGLAQQFFPSTSFQLKDEEDWVSLRESLCFKVRAMLRENSKAIALMLSQSLLIPGQNPAANLSSPALSC